MKPEEIAALRTTSTEVYLWIKAHPGARCADIAFALDVGPSHVAAELRVLCSTGAIAGDDGSPTRYTAKPRLY